MLKVCSVTPESFALWDGTMWVALALTPLPSQDSSDRKLYPKIRGTVAPQQARLQVLWTGAAEAISSLLRAIPGHLQPVSLTAYEEVVTSSGPAGWAALRAPSLAREPLLKLEPGSRSLPASSSSSGTCLHLGRLSADSRLQHQSQRWLL